MKQIYKIILALAQNHFTKEVGFAFFVSQLAWPFMFIFNTIFIHLNPRLVDFYMFLCGYGLLASIAFITKKIFPGKDWIMYSSTVFGFTCMVDLIISLEVNKNMSGFMTEYLKYGEPYLNSSFGFSICLFDGVVYYTFYMIFIYSIAKGKNYKRLGLYWCGAIICSSLIVEIFGFCIGGPHGPTFASLLNTPYIVVPIIALFKFLHYGDPLLWSENPIPFGYFGGKVANHVTQGVLIFLTVFSIWCSLSLAYGSLGSDFWLFTAIWKATPSISYRDPEPFTQIQVLVYLFYVVPISIAFIYFCFRASKPRILLDLCIIQAGIVLQGQATVIIISLYQVTTPVEFQSDPLSLVFWFSQLLILVVPHLQVWYLFKRHCQEGDEHIEILGQHDQPTLGRQYDEAV